MSSKQLTVDIERYQLLADQFDGVSYELEQAKKRIAELTEELTELTNNHVCERCREFSAEKEYLRKSISKLEAMINVAKIDVDKDAELRSFTNKLYRFKNASMGLNFDTIDEYIAAKTALYDLVKDLIEKAGDKNES